MFLASSSLFLTNTQLYGRDFYALVYFIVLEEEHKTQDHHNYTISSGSGRCGVFYIYPALNNTCGRLDGLNAIFCPREHFNTAVA